MRLCTNFLIVFMLLASATLVHGQIPHFGQSESEVLGLFKHTEMFVVNRDSSIRYFSPVLFCGVAGWADIFFKNGHVNEWSWLRDDSSKWAGDAPLRKQPAKWQRILVGMRADCTKATYHRMVKLLSKSYGRPTRRSTSKVQLWTIWKLSNNTEVKIIYWRSSIKIREMFDPQN